MAKKASNYRTTVFGKVTRNIPYFGEDLDIDLINQIFLKDLIYQI